MALGKAASATGIYSSALGESANASGIDATALGAVTASKDDAPAAVQAAIHNVAGLGSGSIGGGLIQTTSG